MQGHRGAQGACAARRRLRHGPRRQGQPLDPVPEREQLGARHRRVHAGRRRRRATGTSRPSPPASRCKTMQARDLMRQISQAAWECADPGMQFDTTINRWHTAPNTGRINASNPCSEYMHLDNSACNLASINLLKYLDDDGTFDVEALQAHGRGDVHRAGDPRRQRRLPDREDRREQPQVPPARPRLREPRRAAHGAGHALRLRRRSGVGGGAHRADDRPRLRHERAHRGPHGSVRRLRRERRRHASTCCACTAPRRPRSTRSSCRRSCSAPRSSAWDEAVELGETYGVRNSQATVLAPTGTIGLMMDCDTTGIEPDLALTKAKKLVGGGTMFIVNQTIPRALRQPRLLRRRRSTRSSPTSTSTRRSSARRDFKPEHLPVFACSMGDNTIHYMGHVKMMGAVQPFISRRDLEDGEHAGGGDGRRRRGAAHRGVEARPQGRRPLPRQLQGRPAARPRRRRAARPVHRRRWPTTPAQVVERIVEHVIVQEPVRQKLPRTRNSKTFSFRVADCHGYATVGEFEDGRPGEVFLKVAKQGSTLAGIMDAFAISVSHGPAVRRAARGVRREVHQHALRARGHDRRPRPADRHQPRRLHLPHARRRVPAVRRAASSMGVLTVGERLQPTLPGVEEAIDAERARPTTCSRSRTVRRRRRSPRAPPAPAAPPAART